ncbi:MAG: AI-2E family transporter [Ignavibacteriales bacterium]|nr:AI-2E family transporter [Ignavibacteriales bacterium]
MNDIFNSRYWKVFLVTFCISAPIFILSLFEEVFLLMVMSMVLTFVLKPLVDKFEARGLSRTVSILTIYLLLAAFVVVGLITVYPIVVAQVMDISTRLDQQHLVPMLNKFSASLSQQIPFLKADEITVRINTMLSEMSRSMETLLTSALSLAASLIIVPFITFFLLLDYYAMQKNLVENVPNK